MLHCFQTVETGDDSEWVEGHGDILAMMVSSVADLEGVCLQSQKMLKLSIKFTD